jgi:hypothetical protein
MAASWLAKEATTNASRCPGPMWLKARATTTGRTPAWWYASATISCAAFVLP